MASDDDLSSRTSRLRAATVALLVQNCCVAATCLVVAVFLMVT